MFCAALLSCGGAPPARQAGDPLLPAARSLTKGIAFYRQGCYDRSLKLFRRAHEIYTAADDRAGAAIALNNIGNVYRARKDLGRSLLYYDAAVDLFAEIPDAGGLARARVNRASALIDAGRLDEAEKALQAARARPGEQPQVSWMLASGVLASRRGLSRQAEEELSRALKKAGDESPEEAAGVHYALARVLLENGRPAEAVEHAETALAADRDDGAFRKIADDLLLLGDARLKAGRIPDAASAFRRAMKIYALLGDAGAVADAAARLKAAGVEAVHPLTIEFVEDWLKGDVSGKICR